MFTGLIETQAIVSSVKTKKDPNQGKVLWIQSQLALNEVCVGDSICHNGVCLSIIALQREQGMYAVQMSETSLKKTNFDIVKVGSILNVERSLRLQDRLHGHIVLGHVDETIAIQSISSSSVVQLGPATMPQFLVLHGSITLDGVSLTISRKMERNFEVSLIDHTLHHTNLKRWQVGQMVNVEYDYLVKSFLAGGKMKWQGEQVGQRKNEKE